MTPIDPPAWRRLWRWLNAPVPVNRAFFGSLLAVWLATLPQALLWLGELLT